MPRYLLLVLLAATLAACESAVPPAGQSASDSDMALFVARLGADTVAVERVRRGARGAEVTLITRVPATQRMEARLDLDADSRMLAFSSETRGADGQLLRSLRMTRDGDSLLVQADDAAPRMLAAGPDALPFIEYAHAPFDVALRRGTDGALPMVMGRSVREFTVTQEGETATVRHPSRGPMAVTLTPGGGIATLDAAETTRKLIVTRAPGLDMDAFERRAAALDEAGQGLGALSGRAETQTTVDGATISLDHGQPSLRGRQVWGTVVPYGTVWRTGADGATHLTTDRPLVLGTGTSAVRIPAGSVTLFSIPEEDGGMLIVNGQTGQNGNRYDAAQDLGRIPFELESVASPVEQLEIDAEPKDDGGRLVLRWGDRALSVPFRVE